MKGKNNAKFGVQVSHTFLTEGFNFGITDPTFNDPADPAFLPGLLPFDLTRGGKPFLFHGHTDIKQEALRKTVLPRETPRAVGRAGSTTIMALLKPD